MALQTSGAISLGDIHVEASGSGYAFASTSSLNDSDIRGLIGKASGAQMSFSEWYGASAGTDYTVTQGTYSGQFFTQRGFQTNLHGSITPTTFGVYSVQGIYRTSASSGDFFYIRFNYSATPPTNAFTQFSLTANGTAITGLASDASTSTANGGYTRLWMFNASNGLTSSELSDIATEFDGSGNIVVTLS